MRTTHRTHVPFHTVEGRTPEGYGPACRCGHARSRHVSYTSPTHAPEFGACVDCATRLAAHQCHDYTDAATALAEATADAYSFDRYGETNWRRTISRFLNLGFTEREVEAIMRSKWTRWAADQCEGRITSLACVYYIQKHLTARELKELVEGTFTS